VARGVRIARAGNARSLRARVVIAGVLLFLSPLLFVGVTALVELILAHETEERAEACAVEIAAAWSARAPLESVAGDACRRHHLRVRVLEGGIERFFADHLVSSSADDRIGDVFYGPRGGALTTFEDDLAPVADRPETLEAEQSGTSERCTVVTAANLRVCSVALRVTRGDERAIVHVIGSSRSGDPSRYALRRQLTALLLFTAAIAIGLVSWLQRRVTGFVSALARDVDAIEESRRAPLDENRPRELAEVARAFNRLRERLARADTQNEEFLADLAHEMKNPVAAIAAAAESLEAKSSDDPARRAHLARSIATSTARLDRLIGQFLVLARAEAGLPREEREVVDLAALVRGVASVADLPDGKTLAVDAPSEPLAVQGVPARLEGALRNLIDNAIAFAEREITVSVQREAAELIVTVHDDGSGIAPEDLPRVFERFFSARADGRGTGLGLAIVRATLEAHGGKVDVRSAAGTGTSFVVRLPAAVR
jgi:signal transduction histidine kinase